MWGEGGRQWDWPTGVVLMRVWSLAARPNCVKATGWGVYVKKPQGLCRFYDTDFVFTTLSGDSILDGTRIYL